MKKKDTVTDRTTKSKVSLPIDDVSEDEVVVNYDYLNKLNENIVARKPTEFRAASIFSQGKG